MTDDDQKKMASIMRKELDAAINRALDRIEMPHAGHFICVEWEER